MSRGTALWAAGHTAVRAPDHGPLPHLADGSPILGREHGPGHAKCSCGEVSPESLTSSHAREMWVRRHKEEIVGVPRSDAGMAERHR